MPSLEMLVLHAGPETGGAPVSQSMDEMMGQGFRFLWNWGTFWNRRNLYKKTRLHLNQDRTRLLAKH